MSIEEFSANNEMAMKALISNCKNAQIEYRGFFNNGLTSWMDEFCTVKTKSSRRTGQTLAAIKIMMDNLWFQNAVLIDANELAAEHQRKNAEKAFKRSLPAEKFFGISRFLQTAPGRYSGQYDGLFIDAGNVLRKGNHIEEIYNAMFSNVQMRYANNQPFCFVLFA